MRDNPLKSVSALWFAQITKLTLSFGVSVLTIRYLGPNQYGILAIAGSVAIMFSAVVGLPQGSLIVREMAKHKNDGIENVLSTSFDMKLLGVGLQLLLSLFAILLLGYDSTTNIAIFLIALTYITGPFSVLISGLEYDGHFSRIAAIDLVVAFFSLSVRLMLVLIEAPLLWFAAAGIFDAGISIIAYLVMSQRRKQLSPFRGFSLPLCITLLKDGWPLVLTGLAIAVYTRTDVLFISKMLGEGEAGLYMAGIRMTEVFFFFPGVIASIYFPKLARLYNDDREEYYKLITKSCSIALGVGLILATGLFVAASFGLTALLGERFAQSVLVVQITAWSIVIIGVGSAFNSSLIIEHATRIPLYSVLVGAFVNVLLNLILIPLMGIAGAAIATLLAQVSSILARIVIYRDPILLSALVHSMSPIYILSVWRKIFEEIFQKFRNA